MRRLGEHLGDAQRDEQAQPVRLSSPNLPAEVVDSCDEVGLLAPLPHPSDASRRQPWQPRGRCGPARSDRRRWPGGCSAVGNRRDLSGSSALVVAWLSRTCSCVSPPSRLRAPRQSPPSRNRFNVPCARALHATSATPDRPVGRLRQPTAPPVRDLFGAVLLRSTTWEPGPHRSFLTWGPPARRASLKTSFFSVVSYQLSGRFHCRLEPPQT